jgi:hypothetical protein
MEALIALVLVFGFVGIIFGLKVGLKKLFKKSDKKNACCS